MRVAIVYDRVNKWGGAERVLLALHEIFPDAPLYTSVYNPKTASWAKVFPKIYTSFLQNFPLARTRHEYYAALMPLAFESFSFDGYDLVISVTSESAKGIMTKPGTKHLCYCLTPTRYLWSGYDTYFTNFTKLILKPILKYLQGWDLVAAQRPDIMIAISTEVQNRIKKYYRRDSLKIFPPAGFETTTKKIKSGKYFLLVSRLVTYKKVDVVIKAFNETKYRLVIVGTGIEGEKLRRLAKPNIQFVGQVTDEELAAYYRGCEALIFPQEEDFGIVAVEAQLYGKPVIAYGRGGIKDIVNERTGLLFDKQSKDALIEALKSFHNLKFDVRLIQRNAQRFSRAIFKNNFLNLVKNL